MDKIKELLESNNKTELHKELPRLTRLKDNHKQIVQDLIAGNCPAIHLNYDMNNYIEARELHEEVVIKLEPEVYNNTLSGNGGYVTMKKNIS